MEWNSEKIVAVAGVIVGFLVIGFLLGGYLGISANTTQSEAPINLASERDAILGTDINPNEDGQESQSPQEVVFQDTATCVVSSSCQGRCCNPDCTARTSGQCNCGGSCDPSCQGACGNPDCTARARGTCNCRG